MAKKKNILAIIWESLKKTGGCCGSGETCGQSAKKETKKSTKSK